MPFEAALLDTSPPPIYQQIAPKALHLHQLGPSRAAIARRLGVTRKTAAKAVARLRCVNRSGASSGTSQTSSFSRRQSDRHASTFYTGGHMCQERPGRRARSGKGSGTSAIRVQTKTTGGFVAAGKAATTSPTTREMRDPGLGVRSRLRGQTGPSPRACAPLSQSGSR